MSRATPEFITARSRLSAALLSGLLVAIILIVGHNAKYAPLAGWDTAAILYILSILRLVTRYDSAQTKTHALSENPGRALADSVLLTASIASLVAVAVLIFQASQAHGITRLADIALGLVSVVVGWAIVHTIFLLKYARIYYGDPEGGIIFNERHRPKYADFAYLAFTIGMTYQVADNNIQTSELRSTILKQALLSYLFGTIIIATSISAVASLIKTG